MEQKLLQVITKFTPLHHQDVLQLQQQAHVHQMMKFHIWSLLAIGGGGGSTGSNWGGGGGVEDLERLNLQLMTILLQFL